MAADPGDRLVRVKATTGDSESPYYGKQGWVQRIAVDNIIDVLLMINLPNIGQVHTGMYLIVLDDGSAASFADWATLLDNVGTLDFLP